MHKLMQTMIHHLEEGEDVVLATVIDSSGSTPRSTGSQMVVCANGTIIGTIGGGLIEAEAMRLAREIFETGIAQTKTFELTGITAATADRMICGGRMEILLECITARRENLEMVKALVEALQDKPKSYLVTDLGSSEDHRGMMKRCLIQEGSVIWGEFLYPVSWLDSLVLRASKERLPKVLEIETERFFVEPAVSSATVYLFGAGHVSQQVALVASMVHFRTVVLDDRSEFANQERFPQADEVKVVTSFNQAFADLQIDSESYLVIVTRGHLHDKAVLAQALRTDAGYVGMIGSRRKRDMVYQALLKEGFSQHDIDRVHSPIGVNIGGETPEEIAVSIVAELIKERSERNRS
nr:XdhC family protein [Deltaproteobacteria bacterium]